MKKIGKNIANLVRATGITLGMAVPVVFTGCKKIEDPIPPTVKSMTQSVGLKDKAKIEYSATLSNVNKARLNVKKDGVSISTEEISDVSSIGADYQKTYSYALDPKITKGDYEFTLESENLSDNFEKKTNYVNIPNYNASVTYGTSLDLNQNSEITVPLILADDNPEDIVHAISATSSQVQATLDKNDNLKIKAPSNYYGPYQLELQFGSTEGGLEKKTLQGNIIQNNKIDYTHRPNPGLNHYGSGDADGDNQLPVNQNDLNRLTEVANGSYTNPNDPRLRKRCDLNGDGNVNLQDVQVLRDKLNGVIPYLPGDWDNLPTRAEKEDWAKKMFAIDKTNSTAFPGGDCNQFTDQAYINFHGASATDIPKFQQVYNYDFTDNGLYNLPLLEVTTQEYDAEGTFLYGHAMNAFIFDNPSSTFGNICPVEPQKDHINVQFGEDYLIGTNSTFYIGGPPISGVVKLQNGKKIIEMPWYVEYDVKNKIPTLKWMNPDLINEGGK